MKIVLYQAVSNPRQAERSLLSLGFRRFVGIFIKEITLGPCCHFGQMIY
jgi:hypothetical protein